jgi:NAD(P)-dependent dehydrogenase (short-subunit alcohol dehydrogenase family)
MTSEPATPVPSQPGSAKTWFITGTSRGFGRAWTSAALARGDRVAATARDLEALADLAAQFGSALLPLSLDVTDRSACFAAVRQAHEHFGRLDVVVNNAGYALKGMIEEVTEPEARHELDTNLFGPLWITQAALPFLRARRSGHIIQVSSVGGVLAFAGMGMYNASKWALEGFSEALAAEVQPLGIKVTVIEPGGFATDVSVSARQATRNNAYDAIHGAAAAGRAGRRATVGDPVQSAEVLLRIVDADRPPFRVFFGGRWLGIVDAVYHQRLNDWRDWQSISELAE